MKQNNKSSLAIAVGTSLFAGLGSAAVHADMAINADPFAMSELSSGYMNLAEADGEKEGAMKMKDGSCGEGKCGGEMKDKADKAMEGSCADKKMDKAKKAAEGQCGDKKMNKE